MNEQNNETAKLNKLNNKKKVSKFYVYTIGINRST